MASGRKQDDKLSKDPRTMRARLRRGVKHTKDLELYVEAGHMKPLEEWDVEELARGRPRNRDGNFRGRPPSWLTIAVTKEAKRRLLQHAFGELASNIDSAVRVLTEVIHSTDVDDNGKPIVDVKTRVDAAKFIIEHVIGKPQSRVEIDASDTVKEFLADALVIEDGEGGYVPAHPVIEGAIVEEDEGDDDDE